MSTILPRPTADELRSIAALRLSPQWKGFGAWLDGAYDNALKQLLTCADADLPAARSMAAALSTIRETFDTAPDTVRETGMT